MWPSEDQRSIDTVLPVRFRESRSRWRLRAQEMIPDAMFCLRVLEARDKGGCAADIDVIKDERNRFVFLACSNNDQKRFVAKVFPMACLRHRLKYRWMAHRHRRFALGEALSLLTAAARGLAVPAVWGYGEMYGSWGLISRSVLLLECLDDHSPLVDILAVNKDNAGKCLEAMRRSIPLIVRLYAAGCSHISVNSGAIMLSRDSAKQDCMLDFEYAKFLDAPGMELLIFEAATLAKYCSRFVSRATIDQWMGDLLDAVEIDHGYTRAYLAKRFGYYLETELSRRDRLKIGVA